MGTFEGCLSLGNSSNGTNSSDNWNRFVAYSRHPKDVPFVSEFWWGTFVLYKRVFVKNNLKHIELNVDIVYTIMFILWCKTRKLFAI